MAGRANKAALEAAANGPDYAAALSIIEGRISTAKTKQSQASGEASQAWASIEKMGIHKGGAQAAAKVLGMEDDEDQQDFLRSFAKMLEAAGVTLKADLVDVAEGKHDRSVVPIEGLTPNHGRAEPPTGKVEAQPGPPGDTDLNEGDQTPSVLDKADGEIAEANAAAEAGQPRQDEEPPVERPARKAARRHLSVVDAKAAAAGHLGGAAVSPDALH